ncbi:hypothetical protein NDU88_005408 [Pleurodeles waltl]|uniref:Uncharacterized protein n=1 Tax=Pleurodeles waltl TaxID=8319 RepID=A0AAV7WY74_PLEWA|nr:hypothetical protein NDU88_005408 [Pleurodeles waltl]
MAMEPVGCNAQVCLLGLGKDLQLTNDSLLKVALLLAKNRVTLHWGKFAAPTKRQRLYEMAYSREECGLYAEELPTLSRPEDIRPPLLPTC